MTTPIARLPEGPAGSDITYRRYRGVGDIDGMATANARLRALAGVLEPIDLESMRHHYAHLVNSDPLVDCLIVERDGVTVGYGRVEWHDLVDGDRSYDNVIVLAPDAWGAGIATDLVDWTEQHSVEVARANATDRRSWFANYAFGGDAELNAALAERGYTAVRFDAEMLRPDLENLPDVPAPEGYVLRSPTEAELPAVFAMSVEGFSEHWGQHEADEQNYEAWVEDPRFRLDLVVVAWKGDEPAALVHNVLEDRPGGSVTGLLDGVTTHPRHRRLGLARACIAESLRRLRAAGASSAYLGVDTDNQNRAYALYESCGFRVATSGTSYRKPFTMETP
jgi:ribosomal protein S18 acetylase RimI-like enzyme